MVRRNLISAGVSKCGPGRPTYTPSASLMRDRVNPLGVRQSLPLQAFQVTRAKS